MTGLVRHIPSDGHARLLILHARSRSFPTHLVVIMLVASLYLMLRRWASFDPVGKWGDGEVFKQFAVVQVVPALLAGIVGVAVGSSFGEPERVSAMPMARLRAIFLVTLLVVAAAMSLWLLSGWVARREGIDLTLVAVRNLLGMTGMALLAGRALDARLTWILPLCWSILAVLLAIRQGDEQGTWELAGWVWSGQPQSSTTSMFVAVTLFLLGAATFLHRGPKDTAAET